MGIRLPHSSTPRCAFFAVLIGRTARRDGSPVLDRRSGARLPARRCARTS
jgi:hypothetical protein